MCAVLLFVLMLSPCAWSQEEQSDQGERVIGGIFYQDDIDLKETLILSARLFKFNTIIREVQNNGDILEISNSVCELAEEGVMGIVDGVGGRATENIQALCDMLELPHVVIDHTDLLSKNWSILSLFPSPNVFNFALRELIERKEWENFTILYSRGYSMMKVSELLLMGNTSEGQAIIIKELGGDDYSRRDCCPRRLLDIDLPPPWISKIMKGLLPYSPRLDGMLRHRKTLLPIFRRDVLIQAKENGYVNFVVDCPSANLELLLLHAQQVGLVSDQYSYIFVSPDLFTLDMERYQYGGVNMTGLRLVNLIDNIDVWNFTAEYNQAFNNSEEMQLLPEQLKTKVLLIHDAVKIFSTALDKINTTITPSSLSCEDYTSWKFGSTLLNFMKTNKIDGLTGPLIFDGTGHRSQAYFDILELTSSGNQTIGQWKIDNTLNMTQPFVPDVEIGEESILRNKSLKVLIATTPPYGYEKQSSARLKGNDRYEGFTIDIIDRLSQMLGFSYEFQVEKVYGKRKDNGEYTGMVKLLRDEKADLAICDFTMTSERQSGIDFSTPFMTLGIGILYKQPSKQPPEMFSFMAVFSKEVWINMMLIQIGLGILMIFVGRISNKEWQNPVPCVEEPEELTNQFSFANSLWLIIGSVMQQGSEIAPIAFAPRMITSVWWFFTLVMVASYVGTLVAFLTIEKNVMPFETVDELYRHKSIQYGAKDNGSTIDFFKASKKKEFKAMYTKMKQNSWLVDDNDPGVLKAESSNYAFFMESASIEYTIERHCDLQQVGDLLDSKSYGIGMKQGSPYKVYIDDALLKMKERGEIQKLKNIWWKEKHGGGKCGEKQDEEQKQLGMKHMLGAFVVLGGGCLIGLFISALEMLWGVFKRTVKYGTTFKHELVEELKFALQFSGSVKPVKRKLKPVDGSDEAFAAAEGKDDIMSLPSLRSGRSTSTRKTCHSHSSKHSSRSLAVAFAKRRSYS